MNKNRGIQLTIAILECAIFLIMAALIQFVYGNVAAILNWPVFSYAHWLASVFIFDFIVYELSDLFRKNK